MTTRWRVILTGPFEAKIQEYDEGPGVWATVRGLTGLHSELAYDLVREHHAHAAMVEALEQIADDCRIYVMDANIEGGKPKKFPVEYTARIAQAALRLAKSE